MKRVLQVYDSISVSSGISTVIMSWYRNIDKTNITMDVLCCWNRKPSYENEIYKYGSKVFYIENEDKIKNYFIFIKKVKYFMKNQAKNYDIIHLHSAIFAYPILYYAKKYGVSERIVHVHSSSLGNTRFSKYRNLICLIPMKHLANHYWACSYDAAKVWYEKLNINKYTIMLNGINVRDFHKNINARSYYRKLWNVSDDEILLGHISNMSPIKNVPFILKILNMMIKKKYKVKLALIGKDVLPGNVQKLINELGLEDVVINVGVSNEINKCIQAIDVGIMPSISEGYGLVPIEFQAAQIPVLLSNGFPNVVIATEYAIQLDLNVNIWVDNIIDCMQHGNMINIEEKMKLYDLDFIVDKVAKLYESY